MISLRDLWDFRFAASGSRYVNITREDFEEWLSSTYRKWQAKPNTVGVYLIPLSKHVAVQVSSSQNRGGASMGYAKGSMQTRLVSLHSGRVLNKKAQGQSHYKRTKNWRANLEKGIATIKDVYLKSQTFYDGIAQVEDREKYKDETLTWLEGHDGWESNSFLADLHAKVGKGMVLTKKQRAAAEKIMVQGSSDEDASPKEERLADLRDLWKAARAADDRWLMSFVESVGKQYKSRGTLTDKQIALLERKFREYGI